MQTLEIGAIPIKNFPAVSNTALMTLYCRAMDCQAKAPILNDQFSLGLYTRIECDWDTVKKKMRRHDFVLTAVRVRKFDQICLHFLRQSPAGIIVSLGAGLDYRFGRIDNGQCTLIELDLPDVLEFKKQLIPASSRNILIGKSVLDYSWIELVKERSLSLHTPVYFIAEGLIPYFESTDVKALFRRIGENFPGAEIFCDVCGEKAVKMMSRHSGIQEWNVQLKCGFKSGHDLEDWGIGFQLLEEWFLSDDPDAKRGLMKFMWVIPMFKYWLYFIRGKFTGELK
jgi:methyltransferase (TIGR00027 family)